MHRIVVIGMKNFGSGKVTNFLLQDSFRKHFDYQLLPWFFSGFLPCVARTTAIPAHYNQVESGPPCSYRDSD